MTIQINRSLVDGPIAIPIYGPPETDPATGAITRPVIGYEPGAHYNVAEGAMTPALRAYEVQVTTPSRVFAGDPAPAYPLTAFLRFPDQAAAEQALMEAGLASA